MFSAILAVIVFTLMLDDNGAFIGVIVGLILLIVGVFGPRSSEHPIIDWRAQGPIKFVFLSCIQVGLFAGLGWVTFLVAT